MSISRTPHNSINSGADCSPEVSTQLPFVVDGQPPSLRLEDLCPERRMCVMEIVKQCLANFNSANGADDQSESSSLGRVYTCIESMIEPVNDSNNALVESAQYALQYLKAKSGQLEQPYDVFELRREVEKEYGSLIMQICTKKKKVA